MSDENDVLSDDDYQKIAKDVKALKAPGKQEHELKVGMDVPDKEHIFGGVRDDKIDLRENAAPKSQAQPHGCVFCKIVKKEIPARVVHENHDFVGFLDIQPKSCGHVVIVSKRHVADMIELDVAEQNSLNDVLRELCMRMRKKLGATGYTVVCSNGVSSGQAVPHFSMHVIPTYANNAVELPVLSLIQAQKVPGFVMDDVVKKLSSAGGHEKKKTGSEGAYKGYGVE